MEIRGLYFFIILKKLSKIIDVNLKHYIKFIYAEILL